MSKFNYGDTVRCVKPAVALTIGSEYTVVKPQEGYDDQHDTWVIDDNGELNGWVNDRFELVEKPRTYRIRPANDAQSGGSVPFKSVDEAKEYIRTKLGLDREYTVYEETVVATFKPERALVEVK